MRHVRVLIDEARAIVHLIVDHKVEVLLGRVFRDVGVGELLGGGHGVDTGGFFSREERRATRRRLGRGN